ncbi:2Fe-2S iron-sulfur cluster-binding protein [Terricaulis sp.]|uniref:2Fe-2S iron-sulfur cluster-binding protein n=1 Tax=Terricaulis sp. TaxID=2768686 RepID=UPI0037850887
MRINVTLRSGEQKAVEASPGQSLKAALMDGGAEEINALTSCGGCCSCGTCHVYVDERDLARLPAMSSQEDDLLYVRDDRRPNSRLACSVPLSEGMDGVRVTIAPEW